jgi:hypothetical protein
MMKLCIPIVALILLGSSAHADFDVNSVAGVVTIDGEPAPSGLQVCIERVDTGDVLLTEVDGADVPPFLQGCGMYDSGDLPSLSTGDIVKLYVKSVSGGCQVELVGGTTRVNLTLEADKAPEEGPQSDSGSTNSDDSVEVEGAEEGPAGESLFDCAEMLVERAYSAIHLLRQGAGVLIESIDDRSDAVLEELDMTSSRGRREVAYLADTVNDGALAAGFVAASVAGFMGMLFTLIRRRRPREIEPEASVEREPFWDAAPAPNDRPEG